MPTYTMPMTNPTQPTQPTHMKQQNDDEQPIQEYDS
jgi:hypothetical protein